MLIFILCVIFLLLLLILAGICGYFFYEHQRKRRVDLFARYDVLLAILQSCQDSAYDKIYQDDMAVQQASGFRLNGEELDKLQRKYVEITCMLCGQAIIDELIQIQGDFDSLTALLVTTFVTKIVGDEASLLKEIDQTEEIGD